MSDTRDTNDRQQAPEDEDAMAHLLELAGRRPGTSAERTARVREAVLHSWQSNRRRRAVTRNALGAAAGLATAAVVVLLVNRGISDRRPIVTPPEPVASADRIDGTPRILRTMDGQEISSPLTAGFSIVPNDMIVTDAVSRLALRTPDGSSLRFDRASRARVLSQSSFELSEGAVYVATSDASKGLEVRTRFGIVRDVGTRFEVRMQAGTLQLRVRSGLVEIHHDGKIIPARAGTETNVTTARVESRAVATYGSDWDWTATVAPAFEIEGRALSSFLEYLTREQGWSLRYADAALATAASSIVLHGSVRDLQPEEALSVALATSGLQYRLREGELLVFKPSGAQ